MKTYPVEIRLECLRPYDAIWKPPTGVEVRELLRRSEMSAAAAAQFLGLGIGGDRTVRRWISGHPETGVSSISYAAWALLCDKAGEGIIWRKE